MKDCKSRDCCARLKEMKMTDKERDKLLKKVNEYVCEKLNALKIAYEYMYKELSSPQCACTQNGICVRENEIHEPTVEIVFNQDHQTGCVEVRCTVCDAILDQYPDFTGSDKIFIKYDNYCPTCGARLKEI